MRITIAGSSDCPVCGMRVAIEAYSLRYRGVCYIFCSDVCKRSFAQQPEFYIKMQVSRISERNSELELVRIETIQCLSRAAEYKDNETGAHIQRMADYCKQMAILSGLDMIHVELMEVASPMHDIGKIGVPETILLKDGALDADERRWIEKHPEIGAAILGKNLQSELMRTASVIALTHHEKWDGSGYPRGLRAEQIPVEGRIVGICDVFDALVSERPYKTAWPTNKVRSHIEEQKGKHFDPMLTSLFVDNFADFLAIHERWKDVP